MKRNILIFGLCGGLLIAALRLIEYRFLIVSHSLEIYGGLVALVFAGVGIWLGLKFTRKEEVVVIREVSVPAPSTFVLNERKQEELGITKRELEILSLIASGLSNREIAEKLFVSENTVKTHSSRLFEKMNAKRRTQAVQIGKESGLIPNRPKSNVQPVSKSKSTSKVRFPEVLTLVGIAVTSMASGLDFGHGRLDIADVGLWTGP